MKAAVSGLVILVVILLGAFLIMKWVGGQPEPSSVTATDTSPRPTPFETPSATPAPTAEPQVAAQTPQPTPEATPEPAPEAPMGDIALRVIWVGTDNPVPDAIIRLTTDNAGRPDVTTVTGPDGRAQLQAPVDASLLTLHVGQADASTQTLTLHQFPDVELTVSLHHGITVYGSVWDLNTGLAITSTPLTLTQEFANETTADIQASTRADGTFEITRIPVAKNNRLYVGDDWIVQGNTRNGEYTFKAIAGETVGPAVLKVYKGATIQGHITEKGTANPIAGATISPYPGISSDAAGFYSIKRLRDTSLRLSVRKPGYVPEISLTQAKLGEITEVDFELRKGITLSVTVRDQELQPIEGADVYVEVQASSFDRIGTGKTDNQGRLVAQEYDAANMPRVLVNKDGYQGSSTEKPRLNEDRTQASLDVVLTKTEQDEGWIAGTVTSTDGKPLEGITISFGNTYEVSYSGARTTTDIRGQYKYKVPIEQHQMTAVMAFSREWGTKTQYNVTPGTEQQPAIADFELDPSHWLKLRAISEEGKPLPEVYLFVTIPNDQNSEVRVPINAQHNTNADGVVNLKYLPNAPIKLQFSGRTISATEIIEQELDREVTYTLNGPGHILGLVVDAESGNPVSEFNIKVRGNRVSSMLYDTGMDFHDPRGEFEVSELNADQEYTIIAEAEGYAPLNIDGLRAVSKNPKRTRFELKKAQQIKGTLVDASTGLPLPNIQIAYAEIDGNRGSMYLDWNSITTQQGGRNSQFMNHQLDLTDAQGDFEFSEGSTPGVVFANPEGYQHRAVMPEEREMQGDKMIVRMEKGAILEGILYRDGMPEPGIQLSMNVQRSSSNQRFYEAFGDLRTDSEGHYRVDGLSIDEYVLSAMQTSRNYGISRLSRKIKIEQAGLTVVNLGNDMGPHRLYGKVTTGGEPYAEVAVSLIPSFEWDYTNIATITDAQGNYEIKGLRPGSYRVQLNDFGRNNNPYRQMEDNTITIEGDLQHDIELESFHNVTLRLVYPPEMPTADRPTIHRAQIVNVDRAQLQQNNEAEIQLAGASNVQNNMASFNGRFLGEYQLSLQISRNGRSQQIKVDRTLLLDNIDADFDAGAVEVPMLGKIKVRLHYADESKSKPGVLSLMLFEPGGNRSSAFESQIRLNGSQAEQIVEANVGTYDAIIMSQGSKVEPERYPVIVELGTEPVVEFLITTSGSIMGIVMKANMPEPTTSAEAIMDHLVPLSRVTISGQGINRTLQAQSLDLSNEGAMNEGMIPIYQGNAELAIGPAFAFRNLDEGEYTLILEANGYKTLTQQATVKYGELRPLTPQMEPLGSSN